MKDAMDQVRPDMKVVDSSGAELGTVETLKMGDPEAVTAQGQTDTGGRQNLVGDLADTITGSEPDVPPQVAERLPHRLYQDRLQGAVRQGRLCRG